MGKILLGVILTLAVLHPAVTKELFGKAVDVTNTVATQAIKESQK
jgi:hypothetical protein